MKKILFLAFIFTFVGIALFSHSEITNAQNEPLLPELESTTIQEMTVAQIYRYARELYLKGHYPEAIAAFQKMLHFDCRNPLALYHLQLISKKSDTYSHLNDLLNAAVCETPESNQKSMLPSSFFYETDPSLVRAYMLQAEKENAEHQSNLSHLLNQYVHITQTLQNEVNRLFDMVEDNQETMETQEIKLLEAQATAEKLQTQIHLLQEKIIWDDNISITEENQYQDAVLTLKEQLEQIQQKIQRIQKTVATKNQQLNALSNDLSNTRD